MIGVEDQRYFIKFGMTWSSEEFFMSYCVLERRKYTSKLDRDAMSAVKRYNNVQLDGKPMKIEIVGTNIATPAMPPAANGSKKWTTKRWCTGKDSWWW
ncbi:hypothetical protein ACSBR2_002462 [Camellia fascicularis]